jgi:hypothetical protein
MSVSVFVASKERKITQAVKTTPHINQGQVGGSIASDAEKLAKPFAL